MKKSLLSSLLIISCSLVIHSQATFEEKSTNRIAFTGKDSVFLNHKQTLQIYSFNIQIGEQERQIRQKNSGSDSLGFHLKNLEVRKDSLYQKLLPSDKYQLYKQKKIVLISSSNEVIREREQ